MLPSVPPASYNAVSGDELIHDDCLVVGHVGELASKVAAHIGNREITVAGGMADEVGRYHLIKDPQVPLAEHPFVVPTHNLSRIVVQRFPLQSE